MLKKKCQKLKNGVGFGLIMAMAMGFVQRCFLVKRKDEKGTHYHQLSKNINLVLKHGNPTMSQNHTNQSNLYYLNNTQQGPA